MIRSPNTAGAIPAASSNVARFCDAYVERINVFPAQLKAVIIVRAQVLAEIMDPVNRRYSTTNATTGAPAIPITRNGVSGPRGNRTSVNIETRAANSPAKSHPKIGLLTCLVNERR